MVKRQLMMLALSWLTSGCAGQEHDREPEALVLHGFHLVDVESRSMRDADVVIENGAVVARPTLARRRVVEGHGAYLMPALWDLKASLWGNDSAFDWEVLTQDANFTQCLGYHLYYGVAHVGVFAMDRQWVERELKRADALELSAAEPLYPDKVICGKPDWGCDDVHDAAGARLALEQRAQHRVPLMYVSAMRPQKNGVPGVTRDVLAEVLASAAKRRLPAVVLVDDWAQAQQAVELGASVVYGFPDGAVPDSVIELMRARGVAFAPALARFLELNRLLGNQKALTDPFLTVTLNSDVRDSYRSERGLWQAWRPELALGRARQAVVLASVARIAKAGVHLVVVSDAGWVAGAFQGYSSHAAQVWLERAGLDGFSRLSAATVWPAAVLDRHVGFQPGQAADFVAFDADPVEHAQNLRKIAWVMRKGQLVNREKLLPDLTRRKYKP
jgi:hypothetical protein